VPFPKQIINPSEFFFFFFLPSGGMGRSDKSNFVASSWIDIGCMQLLVLKLKKYKGKRIKNQKVKKLNLSFFYSKVEIKNESFTF
jgi:hypothetical protein